MSLKLIELQVALPRTQDMGKLQEQMQQKSQINQHLLGVESIKETEKARRKLIESEKTGHAEHNKDHKNQQHHQHSQNRKKRAHSSPKPYTRHPYKGTHVDIEG